MAIESINPANGKKIKRYAALKPGAVKSKIGLAREAFEQWKGVRLGKRAALFRSAAALLEKKKIDLARLMALEMGKPLAQAVSEIEKCGWVCRYYSEHAGGCVQPQAMATDASKSYVSFEPLGVVLDVMPCHFPFCEICRFAAPTMMAGNTELHKHA